MFGHYTLIMKFFQKTRARATGRFGRHSRLREADFALRIVGGEVKVALLYQKSLC